MERVNIYSAKPAAYEDPNQAAINLEGIKIPMTY